MTYPPTGVECMAIDWSGALTGSAARIWVATARDGVLQSLHAPGSRDAVQALLLARRAVSEPAVVGLDFAFGLPSWYCTERGWNDVGHVWQAATTEGETWLRECRPPFWGRPGRRRPHDVALGVRAAESMFGGGMSPKSVFQVGGAGSVGTGSIRGMPMLAALRASGWAVWPFDAASMHTLVEIWPRLFTGAVVKSSETARAAWLDRHLPSLGLHLSSAMRQSEDAFDAGISAIGMSRMSLQVTLAQPLDPRCAIEGAICAPPRAEWANGAPPPAFDAFSGQRRP